MELLFKIMQSMLLSRRFPIKRDQLLGWGSADGIVAGNNVVNVFDRAIAFFQIHSVRRSLFIHNDIDKLKNRFESVRLDRLIDAPLVTS